MRLRFFVWASVPIAISAVAVWLTHHREGARAPSVESRLADIATGRSVDEVDCGSLRAQNPVSILVLGQSNAANHGSTGASGSPATFVFSGGKCYRAGDPLPGGTGTGGSIWTRLGPMLSAASDDRPVLFTICAVEATSIEDWASNAALQAKLADVVTSLSAAQLDPQLVFWQQGEADALAGTTTSDYRDRLLLVLGGLRGLGMRGPVLIASSTQCRNANGTAVRDALASIVGTADQVFAGPDTDTIGEEAREGGCHFNEAGLEKAAGLWFSAVRPHFGR